MYKITRQNTALVLATLLVSFGLLFIGGTSVKALSGSEFEAGNIISNSKFFRSPSMSASSIQSFLNGKVPDCDTQGEETYSGSTTRAEYGTSRGVPPPYICLKNYRQNIPSRSSETGLCTAISSQSSVTAANIIYKVSKACGVDTKILIVLLQKEQGLVTDEWPWPIQYRSATGYGCPDTAPCDSQYYGFFNQVYMAARQFKRYSRDADLYNYRSGRNNYILYNPNEACGGSSVYIENQATAGLYNYTPYQPNASALANLYGTGDSCGAYGNRNFWRLYNDWFGSTQSTGFRLISCSDNKYLIEPYIHKKRLLSEEGLAAFELEEAFYDADGSGCNYPAYTLPLGREVRSRDTKSLYFIDLQKVYRVNSRSIAIAWDLVVTLDAPLSDVPQLNGSTLHDFQVIDELPRLAKSDNSGTGATYIMDSGKRYLIEGSPDDTRSLRLFRGYNEIPFGVFSVDLLTTYTRNVDIDHVFKSSDEWFVADHGKIRRLHPGAEDRWLTVVDGPVLSGGLQKAIPKTTTLTNGFQRNSVYYWVDADDSTIRSTTNRNQAKIWGVSESPTITQLLLDKLVP